MDNSNVNKGVIVTSYVMLDSRPNIHPLKDIIAINQSGGGWAFPNKIKYHGLIVYRELTSGKVEHSVLL